MSRSVPLVPDSDDAVEEEDDLRSFAKHGDAADNGERGERALARGDGLADLADLGCEFAPVPRHPGVVPGEHADGEDQDRSVQEFLPGALEGVGDGAGEERDDGRANRARR